MSDVTIILRVPIDPAWKAGTSVQIYSDAGSGVVDYSQPLLAKTYEVFAGAAPEVGLGFAKLGIRGMGNDRPRRRRAGLGQSPLGSRAIDMGLDMIEIPVKVPAGYALHKFAAVAYDASGTAQSDPAVEASVMVSATEPMPIRVFEFKQFDAVNRRAVFDIAV